MPKGMQKVCALCGPIFLVILFAGMLRAGLLPPPSPSKTAEETAQIWNTNPDL